MSRAVHCAWCRARHWCIGELPPICPTCQQEARWLGVGEPTVAWELTHNDKRFLRALRIDVEERASGDPSQNTASPPSPTC